MTIIQSLFLGIIEGLTEFLPISSTAHLILAGKALGLPDSEFLKTFEISIQLGAILAVLVLYFNRILKNLRMTWKLLAAFIPTSIIGLGLYQIVKDFLMESLLIISLSLLLGGLVIIVFEKKYAKKHPAGEAEAVDLDLHSISYPQAIKLGLIQALAMVPGVSRSGATIIGGLALGIKRQTIVEFSFLLAIPTMLAATVLDLYKNPGVFANGQLTIWLVGFITSFITAIIGVKFLLRYVQKNDFRAFGWYRLALGALILGIILL